MSNNFDTLADRIRSEAATSARPGQMRALEAIADEVEALRRGAKTLGHIVSEQGRMVLDVTGRHDLIGEDGDGDWAAVWEHLYDLAPPATCGERRDPCAHDATPTPRTPESADERGA